MREPCPSNNVNELWSRAKSIDPALCKSLLPRRYKTPASHCDAEFAATQLFAGITVQEKVPENLPARYVAIAAARLIQARMPTYFVSPEILQAAWFTDIDNIGWDDIPWPSSSALYMIPNEALLTPNDGSLGFLAVAQNTAYDPIVLPGRMPAVTRQSSVMVCGATANGTMSLFGVNVAREQIQNYESYPFVEEYHVDTERTILQKAVEKAFEFQMWRVGLALHLISTARPDLLTKGSPQRKSRKERRRTSQCDPNWLGRDFQLRIGARVAGDSPSVSGWRRGTFSRNATSEVAGIVWKEPEFIR